jgi:hypothetical protein
MINLNDPRWGSFEDAYGSASRVPDLLRIVTANKTQKSNPQSGPWFDLWSRLYHQGSIYNASYAAVPVLAEAVKQADGSIAMDFFLLPVSIELARRSADAPALPDDIATDYHVAIKNLGNLAGKFISDESDPYLKKAAEAAELISLGKIEQAAELINA